MDKMQERPPFVRFEMRPVEDRAKSIKTGVACYKDVAFALITPSGSKDITEVVADEWFVMLEREAKGGRWPVTWLVHFREAYKAWKSNEELPVNGTPLSHWPGLTKPHRDLLKQLHFTSVEDVASMNEEGITRLGMGGRALKQRAEIFLQSRNGSAAVAERLAASQVENANLKAQLERQGAQLADLTKMVERLVPAPAAAPAEPKAEFSLG